MADRYLKHIPSGIVYIYQGAFASRDDFVEVANLAGDPLPEAIEGEATVVVEDTPVVEKPKRKKAGLSEPAPVVDDLDAALSADASKGL